MADLGSNGKLFNAGHLISLLMMAGMVGGVYATLRSQEAENSRAIDDLYKIVYDMKKDTQDWQGREITYDVEIRARFDSLAAETRDTQRRLSDRINDMMLHMPPAPRPETK